MKNGFSFKGIHSRDMGVTVKSQNRPIIPEVKKTEYSALLMDGNYDFSRANPYNREFYKNRSFELQIYINGANLNELNKKVMKISSWLMGTGDLIFDDTPNVKWIATRSGAISYAPELRGKKAILSVEFEVLPFGYGLWSTCEDITLGSEIFIGTNIPIDMPSQYTFNLTGVSQEETVLKFINYGERPIRPVITIMTDIKTRLSNIVLTHNGKELECSMGHYKYVIDCQKQQITSDVFSSSLMGRFSGEFFEFEPGECEMGFTYLFGGVSGEENVTVTIDFLPQVLWDFDFDSMDWGDNDA